MIIYQMPSLFPEDAMPDTRHKRQRLVTHEFYTLHRA